MIVDELIALLHMGKLDVSTHASFVSVSLKLDLSSAGLGEQLADHFHLFVYPGGIFSNGKIVDATTKRSIYKGKQVKRLTREVNAYICKSQEQRDEETRKSVNRILQKHFDRVIKEHNI